MHAIAIAKGDFLIALTGHPATAVVAITITITSGHGVTDTAEPLTREA